MALAFQKMLAQFGLTEKIHTVNADNAMANDKQTIKLDALPNLFEKENCVWCFNHTLQLFTKALLAPFNPAISQKATQDDKMPEEGDDDQLLPEDDTEDDEDDSEEGAKKNDDEDNDINELDELSENEQVQVLENTVEVHETVTKVSYMKQKMFAFANRLLTIC